MKQILEQQYPVLETKIFYFIIIFTIYVTSMEWHLEMIKKEINSWSYPDCIF